MLLRAKQIRGCASVLLARGRHRLPNALTPVITIRKNILAAIGKDHDTVPGVDFRNITVRSEQIDASTISPKDRLDPREQGDGTHERSRCLVWDGRTSP